jgi:hypothetical protein
MKKTKTRQEVALEYGISRKTLSRRIESMGIKLSKDRGVLLPRDLIQLYRAMGLPEKMTKEEKDLWIQEMSLL